MNYFRLPSVSTNQTNIALLQCTNQWFSSQYNTMYELRNRNLLIVLVLNKQN